MPSIFRWNTLLIQFLSRQVNVQLDKPHLLGHGAGEAMVIREEKQ